ncbi:MAG: cytochrome c nitrite reductase pentaheme subunit [Psychromonas sp.]|nr:cytochrome c nitrite reductase pentaheme subunit [Alteromonadales bacterium]MCP5079613.1 cytochrome c nitrite reductase pentaheme subunit [Psychromonas sp.]
MDNVKLTITTLINALLILCVYGFSSTVSAETPHENSAQENSSRHVVTYNRDSDYKCTQCHKDAKEKLFGTHGEEATKKIGKELKCTQCHDSISADHRENSPKVTKYFPAQSKVVADKHQLSFDSILDSNANCSECHTPERLRKKDWTHDVHAKNATCSNCHVVHADGKKQGIQAKSKKQQIEVCVACHKDFNATDDQGE